MRSDEQAPASGLLHCLAQTKRLLPQLLLLYGLTLGVLLAVVLASQRTGVSIAMFMRDPNAILGVQRADVAFMFPYMGVTSNLGVLLWTAAATLCLVTWAATNGQAGSTRWFFLYFGLLSVALMLDDLFMLHETAPAFFLGLDGGVGELLPFALYALAFLAGIVLYRQQLFADDGLFFLLALAFLALSVFVDLIQPWVQSQIGDWRILFEDGFKLLGIAGWFWFFLRRSLAELRRTDSAG